MNKDKEILEKQFIETCKCYRVPEEDILAYGRQMWNAALDWAAENAELNYGEDEGQSTEIDKKSILKGKL